VSKKSPKKNVSPGKGTYALVSLGCPKNLVDSECMAGRLRLEGYQIVPKPEGADFAVVNTCGFVGDAREESCQVIREMLQLKEQGRLKGVIVAGCLAERDREGLLEQCPGIDCLLGVFSRDQIAAAADRLMAGIGDPEGVFLPPPAQPLPDETRVRLTPRHVAFLKIAEGCNRQCSFCTIPQIRGRYASKPLDQVVAEAERLAADGVRELVLVAQDTSYYGIDLGGRPQLAALLGRLAEIDHLAWIRVMYLYPQHITEDLLDVLSSGRKLLPYLDLPLQHINDEVLRRMRRQVTRQETEGLLDRLRARIPRLVLRTTLITGFPGETEAQFEELLEFVEQRRFERLGVFGYCREPGTAAADLGEPVPEDVIHSRRERLLGVQQEIAFAWNRSQVGRRLQVLIDRDIPGQRHAYVGRTYADAPEVDGVVYVTGKGVRPGQIVACEIVASRGYDLIGAVVS